MANQRERVVIDKILIFFGTVTTVALLAMGGVAWWGSAFITGQVTGELAVQKITFPQKGSTAFSPAEFPGLQQYAGQTVDTPQKAKAFADEYIAVHLSKVAGGRTYAEVSNLVMQDPTNAALQQQKATLFQGETLRGILLNAYAFGTMGELARVAAVIAFAAGAIMLALVLLGLRHLTSIS